MSNFNAAYRMFAPVTWSLDGEYHGCMDVTVPTGRGDGTAHKSRYLYGFDGLHRSSRRKNYPAMGTGCGMWMFDQSWDDCADGHGDGPIFYDQSRVP